MAVLRNGMQGDEVRKLQQSLVNAGYDVGSSGADGIFGKNTESAVRRYQQDNGLTVDGIAGNQTLGSLNTPKKTQNQETVTSTENTSNQQPVNKGYDWNNDPGFQQAYSVLQQTMANAPTYKATFDQQLQDIYDEIVNRDKFTYDLNGDALYQQYAQQYAQMGQMAMEDAMGQAAALTGGYGSSQAQAAGQQAYQAYLQQLNDRLPEFYDRARAAYDQEGQDMLTQYGILGDMRDTEWNEYMSQLDQHWKNVDIAQKGVDDAYNRGFDKWSSQYQISRDQISDSRYDKEAAKTDVNSMLAMGVRPPADLITAAGYDSNYVDSVLSNYNNKKNNASNTEDADKSNEGDAGNMPSNITSDIENKAASAKSNEELANYAYGLADAGVITEEEADALIAKYMDFNEKYVDNGDGTKTLSYSEMVKNTSGWRVENNGGTNWLWGVDNNAIVESPNGELIRLDNLVDKLVSEGMSKKNAKNYVKDLQNNLGI